MVWASPLLFVPYVGRLPAPQPVLQLAPAVESRPAAPPAARSRSTGGAAAWISVPIVALAVASSARQSDEPSTELEKRQRTVIEHLMGRLGFDSAAVESLTLEAIEEASSGEGTVELEKENAVLKEQLEEWQRGLEKIDEQLRLRDELRARLEAAKAESAEAKKQVKPLTSLRNQVEKLEAEKAAFERSVVTMPTDMATLRESIDKLEGEIRQLEPVQANLQEARTSLAERQERLEAEFADADANFRSLR